MGGNFLDVTKHMIDGYALHEVICDAVGRPVDYRFLKINPAFERLTGFAADRVIGRTLLDVMPQTEPVWLERFGNVALTGQELHCEDYAREIGRYFEIKAYRPQPGRIACVFVDITERKLAEQALAENEERYRRLIEGLGEKFSVFSHTTEGVFLYVSRNFHRLFGIAEDEIIGNNWRGLNLTPESLAAGEESDRRVIEEQATQTVELTSIHPDGSRRVIEVTYGPVLQGGHVAFMEGVCQDITERKQHTTALQLKNLIFDASLAANSIADASGVLTEANVSFVQTWGYATKDEVVGRPIASFFQNQEEAEAIITALNGTGKWEGDFTAKRRDGSAFPAHGLATAIRNDSGEIAVYQSSVMDITEHKRAEEELRKSEGHLQSVFRAAPTGVGVVVDRMFKQVNKRMCEMTGYSNEELVGQKARMLYMCDDDYEYVGREKYRQIGDLGTGTVETRWKCKAGHIIDVLLSSTPIDMSGPSKEVVFTALDITERKRLEDDLLLSREKLKDILALLPQPIYEADFGGRLTYANQAAFDLFGYSDGDFSAGLNVLDMVIPEDLDRARENIGNLYMGIDAGGHEYTARRKDGTTFPVIIYSSVVKKDGAPSGTRGVIADIYKQKKYEHELEKARDMAESMSRAKDEFLANMSHELRTPITVVLGFAELLEETPLSEDQHKYLSTISSSTDTLLALVDDLLDLARIEAGKVYLECEEFSLRKLISEIADSQNPAAKAKGLAFRTQVSAEVPDRLTGDSLRLKQVLLNLTVNAIKFSEKGEVSLSVAVENFHPTTPMLRFDVADTGIGIKTENIAGIFQPFSQVDPSSTRKFGGAGLGLAICTKLMGIMGGELSVDSCEGVGSTFHVHLPFEVVESEEEGRGVHPPLQAAVTEIAPLRILLAEDHEISQYFFAEALKRCGHHVELAANGAEALGKLQYRTYDLVLMDIQMPVMDGINAVGKIREMEKARGGHLPVIALTAHAMEKDRIDLLSKGFDGYVSKPMKINVLLDEVKRCLSLIQ